MIMETVQKRFGSLIKVKPEYEERYIILHKYTFPAVLKQIHDSNIRNYSIFLRDGVLFSYFEYIGKDFEEDMSHMAEDEATRDWWRLTDPMQEPFETRKKGEWWASLDEVLHFGEKQVPSYQAQRHAFVASAEYAKPAASFEPEASGLILQNLTAFHLDSKIYLYLEDAGLASNRQPESFKAILQSLLQHLTLLSGCTEWHTLREVFHFDNENY